MNGASLGRRLLACGLLLTGGCGAVPELLVEAAKASAKEALLEKVDQVVKDAVDTVLDGEFDEVLDLDGVPVLQATDDEVD